MNIFVIYGFILTSGLIPVYSIETFTMLGPVKPGTNRLSCLPLQKAQELKKEVLFISWSKFQPDDVEPWAWIGGIRYSDNKSEPSVNDGFEKKYSIYENGILEIRNVTEGDNSDEYMCSARGPQDGYRESIQIKLIFFPQEGNSTCTLCSGGTETNVNYPVNETEVKPENVMLHITVNDSNVHVCVGNVISLSCSADGNPVAHTYQLFENDVLVSNSSIPIVWSKTTTAGGMFSYRCVAYNTVGASNTTTLVTVNGNPSQSNGNNCTFWIVLVAIMSVLVLLRVDVKILCRCLLLHFLNILGTVNPQRERTSDVNHENPTFEGPSSDVRHSEYCDTEENIPTFDSANCDDKHNEDEIPLEL